MKYIKNEDGGTLLVVLGLLVTSLLISVILFDFFSTFMTKRIGQTGADSAAMAASLEAKDIYDTEIKTRVTEEMDILRDRYDALVDSAAEGTTFADLIELLEDTYYDRRAMPRDLKRWIRNPAREVAPLKSLEFFLGDEDDVVRFVCSAVTDNIDDIEDAASYFAEKNGAKEDVEIALDPEDFSIIIVAEKDPTFITVDESGFDPLKAEAAVAIPQPNVLTISCD